MTPSSSGGSPGYPLSAGQHPEARVFRFDNDSLLSCNSTTDTTTSIRITGKMEAGDNHVLQDDFLASSYDSACGPAGRKSPSISVKECATTGDCRGMDGAA